MSSRFLRPPIGRTALISSALAVSASLLGAVGLASHAFGNGACAQRDPSAIAYEDGEESSLPVFTAFSATALHSSLVGPSPAGKRTSR